ncbi:pyrimidine 5'-nucleotidase [Chitinibacter bivalviorum]|uniref:Pyrimidine 5'-nucleotidase n=1 Tax=Chitinibacter bivalviorum TaxID=2739434 RepID=A0A7H9BLQ8_9NEIS|nr:pyrimidine 5'-nucleotidase [Chitinibacter bivalviorum]QLG89535.1 pyrimidine 5'-nucleotidase [Chitinibacter bivalviorum]
MPARHWIFDLDNTLHDASRHAFPVIDAAMTRWLQDNLQLSHQHANELRQHYWHRYGATLLGLRKHHPHLSPHSFLAACHPAETLRQHIHPMAQLKCTLAQLSGDKYLFTNGPLQYAEMMLEQLQITRYFSGIAAVDTVKLQPKPQTGAFLAMLRQFKLQAADCIMVEDSIDNLITAKKLGMKTVWLRPHYRQHPAADVVISKLSQLLQA